MSPAPVALTVLLHACLLGRLAWLRLVSQLPWFTGCVAFSGLTSLLPLVISPSHPGYVWPFWLLWILFTLLWALSAFEAAELALLPFAGARTLARKLFSICLVSAFLLAAVLTGPVLGYIDAARNPLYFVATAWQRGLLLGLGVFNFLFLAALVWFRLPVARVWRTHLCILQLFLLAHLFADLAVITGLAERGSLLSGIWSLIEVVALALWCLLLTGHAADRVSPAGAGVEDARLLGALRQMARAPSHSGSKSPGRP